MPSTFDNFTLGTTAGGATPIQTNDYVVGFDTAVLNGERKWQITTLAQSVSSVMSEEITNKISQQAITTSSPMVAKAWVNFNGTGTIGNNQTIRSDYNVSSVTKNGTGDYTVNFTTPMSDANYSAVANFFSNSSSTNYGNSDGQAACNTFLTSSVRVVTLNTNTNLSESFIVSLIVFGN